MSYTQNVLGNVRLINDSLVPFGASTSQFPDLREVSATDFMEDRRV